MNPLTVKLAPDQGLWPLTRGTALREELITRGLLDPDPPLTPTFSPADLPLDHWGVLAAIDDIASGYTDGLQS